MKSGGSGQHGAKVQSMWLDEGRARQLRRIPITLNYIEILTTLITPTCHAADTVALDALLRACYYQPSALISQNKA